MGADMETSKPKKPLKDRLAERLEDIAGEPLEDWDFEDQEPEEDAAEDQEQR